MKSLRAALVAALCAALVLSGCSASSSGSTTYQFDGAQQVGHLIAVADRKPVGDLTGDLLTGGSYQLSKYKGEPVVVNFWGTWCGPCTIETPQFARVYDQYKAKGVTFLGVDIKEAGRSAPKAFVADNHVGYPIVYDETGKVALQMGNIRTQAVPFTVLLDKQHRVAGVYVIRLLPADLEPMLNKLIAES